MTDSHNPRTGFTPRGFVWWLPLVTAAIAAAAAVAVGSASTHAWDADVLLWAREGRTADEFAQILLDPTIQDTAQGQLLSSEDGPAAFDAVDVSLTDTLIRLTVRSTRETDAETLALALAHAAVAESVDRYGDDAGLDLLGLVQPGARQVSPATERTAAWASAVGLIGGLALALVAARRWRTANAPPAGTLARLGRQGLRPIAVVSDGIEQLAPNEERGEDDELPADAINLAEGTIALIPLDDASPAPGALVHSARALAASGRAVVWLDARRPAFVLYHDVPPRWIEGPRWTPVTRSNLIQRRAAESAPDDGYLLLLTDALHDTDALSAARRADAAILIARADASDDELLRARNRLSGTRLLGVVLTHAQPPDLRDFERAQSTDD